MSLMEMVAAMDAGRVYAKKEVVIDDDDNATSLFKKMANAAIDLVLENMVNYYFGNLPGEEQDESQVSFCPTIKPEQEKLDLNLNVNQIHGWIRGLSDHPGAYFYLDGKKLKVYKSQVLNNDVTAEVGTIVQADKRGFVVQLNGGQLALLEVQKEGKNKMDYKSFLNGNQGLLGKKLD